MSAACCTALTFGTLCYKRHEIRGIVIEYQIVFRFSLQVLSEIFLIQKRI